MSEDKTAKKTEVKSVESNKTEESSVETKKVSMDDLVKEVKEKKEEARAIADANEDVNKENNIDQKEVNKKEGVVDNSDRLLATIGYIHFLCVLPLLLRPESEHCQFHGKQGLVITVFFLMLGWIAKMLSYAWLWTSPIVSIVWICLAIYGMVAAFQGKRKKIPLFGDVAKMLQW